MPQGLIPNATVRVVNSTALQEPISLQATGSQITIGAPGGPVIFANPLQPIVPGLSGSIPRSAVTGKFPSR